MFYSIYRLASRHAWLPCRFRPISAFRAELIKSVNDATPLIRYVLAVEELNDTPSMGYIGDVPTSAKWRDVGRLTRRIAL